MSTSHSLEESIQRGDQLLKSLESVPLCLGRRSEDLKRPEVVEVRDFYARFHHWDLANRELLASSAGSPSAWDEGYKSVEQPEKQRVITDFMNVKAAFQRSILEKLEHLRGFQKAKGQHLEAIAAAPQNVRQPRVFIGHGRSKIWRELKDFLQGSLQLPHEEFNRESAPGLTVIERIQSMLESCTFAFLVMTGDDQHSDGSRHARENVVHEIGLFQGRLGFRRAIVLLEEGCTEFSNIHGLSQIRFPAADIRARFEDIREVLEREGQLDHPAPRIVAA